MARGKKLGVCLKPEGSVCVSNSGRFFPSSHAYKGWDDKAQLDLQNSVTIANSNKSRLGLFVELISWFGLQSLTDNLVIVTLQQR